MLNLAVDFSLADEGWFASIELMYNMHAKLG
jgi:hypothetical protein